MLMCMMTMMTMMKIITKLMTMTDLKKPISFVFGDSLPQKALLLTMMMTMMITTIAMMTMMKMMKMMTKTYLFRPRLFPPSKLCCLASETNQKLSLQSKHRIACKSNLVPFFLYIFICIYILYVYFVFLFCIFICILYLYFKNAVWLSEKSYWTLLAITRYATILLIFHESCYNDDFFSKVNISVC